MICFADFVFYEFWNVLASLCSSWNRPVCTCTSAKIWRWSWCPYALLWAHGVNSQESSRDHAALRRGPTASGPLSLFRQPWSDGLKLVGRCRLFARPEARAYSLWADVAFFAHPEASNLIPNFGPNLFQLWTQFQNQLWTQFVQLWTHLLTQFVSVLDPI